MLTVTVAAPPPFPPSPSLKYFGPCQKKNRPFLEMGPGLGVNHQFRQTDLECANWSFNFYSVLQRKGPPPETAKHIGNQAFYNMMRCSIKGYDLIQTRKLQYSFNNS